MSPAQLLLQIDIGRDAERLAKFLGVHVLDHPDVAAERNRANKAEAELAEAKRIIAGVVLSLRIVDEVMPEIVARAVHGAFIATEQEAMAFDAKHKATP